MRRDVFFEYWLRRLSCYICTRIILASVIDREFELDTAWKSVALLIACVIVQSVSATDDMKNTPSHAKEQVTLMNWTQPPYNRWSFRNPGIHPSVTVPRSGRVHSLPEAPNSKIPEIEFEYEDKHYTVESAMLGDGTDGYLVIHDGQIVYEKYFGDFARDELHIWASCTKSLVALAVGILVSEEKIDLSSKAATYLPELKDTALGTRTLRQLLNMRTALDYTEDYEQFQSNPISAGYFRRVGFVPAFDLMALDPIEHTTPRGVLDYLANFQADPDTSKGEIFVYQSPNVDAIGWIIARVSGLPLNRFIAQHIWGKLGAEHDALFMTDVAFDPVATGGFSSTLRDFARMGLMVLNDGVLNDQSIIPAKWIRDTFILSTHDRTATDQSIYKDQESAAYDEWLEGYKNFLWIHDSDKRIATFRGVYGQSLYINKEKKLVIAAFSTATSASNSLRASNRPRFAAYDAIAASYD